MFEGVGGSLLPLVLVAQEGQFQFLPSQWATRDFGTVGALGQTTKGKLACPAVRAHHGTHQPDERGHGPHGRPAGRPRAGRTPPGRAGYQANVTQSAYGAASRCGNVLYGNHCLVLDGVYRRSAEGAPQFVEAPAPTDEALQTA